MGAVQWMQVKTTGQINSLYFNSLSHDSEKNKEKSVLVGEIDGFFRLLHDIIHLCSISLFLQGVPLIPELPISVNSSSRPALVLSIFVKLPYHNLLI